LTIKPPTGVLVELTSRVDSTNSVVGLLPHDQISRRGDGDAKRRGEARGGAHTVDIARGETSSNRSHHSCELTTSNSLIATKLGSYC
jgi:hypothetical protein